MSDNRRECVFDILKAIAILMVVITHFPWTDADRLRYGFPFWIDTAMPIFMMLSGYFSFRSFFMRQLETFSGLYSLSCLYKRLVRFLFPFLLLAPIDIICGMCGPTHATFTRCVIRLILGGYGPGAYYVPMMIQFVVVFPVVYIILRRYRIYGLLILILFNVLYESCCSTFGINSRVYSMCLFRHIGTVALGGFAACMVTSKTKVGHNVSLMVAGAVMFLVGALYLYFACYGNYNPIIFGRWKTTSVVAAFYTVGMFYFFIGVNQCKDNLCIEPFEKFNSFIIGSMSYETYLMQKVFYAYPATFIYALPINRCFQLLFCAFSCIFLGVMYGWFLRCIKYVHGAGQVKPYSYRVQLI